jgi:hypothetical protein
MALNGRESRFAASGHLELPIQRILLSDADLAIVEGVLDTRSPTVLELASDGSGLRESLERGASNVVALVGARRPLDKLPPGGIPWFPPEDLPELLELLRDHFDAVLRTRPIGAILLGGASSDPSLVRDAAPVLASRCARVFVDPAILSAAPGAEPLANHHPRLGDLGQILTALELFPETAILAVRSGDGSTLEARMQALFHRRNPYRVATTFREPDTHLPVVAPAIWEPKARSRIHLALAADIRCPQRILTHSSLELLEPFGV